MSLGLVLVGLLWAVGMPLRLLRLLAVACAAARRPRSSTPYRIARVTSFLDPFSDPTDGGFQAIRGLYALATGGLWGVGLGNSAMKWNLLPHAHSDYIFAIIGEELGFLGCLVVVPCTACWPTPASGSPAARPTGSCSWPRSRSPSG